jgi:hypothetical protein
MPLFAGGSRNWGSAISSRSTAPAYSHVALLTPGALLRVGLNPGAKVLDLQGRLR